MKWIKLGTHIVDHEKFLAVGAVGRDLFVWGLTYCGKHETDGEIPMVAVLASPWGAGGAANIKVASALVTAGLWARTNTGFLSLKWAEQGNETKTSLSEKREAAKARKDRRPVREKFADGSRELSANEQRTNAEGFKSVSLSLSGSGSLPAERETPAVSTAPGAPMPEWFNGACEAAAMVLGGEVDSRPARWAEYETSRDRKGWAMGHKDAVGWLSTVLRTERERKSTRGGGGAARGAEITKQPYDPNAPWLKLPEVG